MENKTMTDDYINNFLTNFDFKPCGTKNHDMYVVIQAFDKSIFTKESIINDIKKGFEPRCITQLITMIQDVACRSVAIPKYNDCHPESESKFFEATNKDGFRISIYIDDEKIKMII